METRRQAPAHMSLITSGLRNPVYGMYVAYEAPVLMHVFRRHKLCVVSQVQQPARRIEDEWDHGSTRASAALATGRCDNVTARRARVKPAKSMDLTCK